MYKVEAFIGIHATAAVMDPLELGCYSSLPSREIWGLEDQQSLFWPKKGIDSSEAGTLLIQQQGACQSGLVSYVLLKILRLP